MKTSKNRGTYYSPFTKRRSLSADRFGVPCSGGFFVIYNILYLGFSWGGTLATFLKISNRIENKLLI